MAIIWQNGIAPGPVGTAARISRQLGLQEPLILSDDSQYGLNFSGGVGLSDAIEVIGRDVIRIQLDLNGNTGFSMQPQATLNYANESGPWENIGAAITTGGMIVLDGWYGLIRFNVTAAGTGGTPTIRVLLAKS